MCGIVGALAFDGSPLRITPGWVERLRDAMPHRGPDGAGVWVSPDGRVGLGHRRLSIVDLSPAAAQPMANEDETVWVSFNGEVYDHAELRAELEATGRHRWRTHHSDTEVILHAFEEHGIGCLDRLRGDFAIALWDGRRRELWLARDPVGVKPLYWTVHDGRLVFASEVKALLEDPDQRRAVDEVALWHHLTFLTAPAPRTLFAGVNKLPGGHWLRCGLDGQVEVRRWWYPWDRVAPLRGATDEELQARLLAGLRESVRLRKVGDVPVGVFLSGGVDSSTNAALFAEGEGRAVRTFTIGYRGRHEGYRNEVDHARRMAARIGAEHHERLLDEGDVLRLLPHMVHLQDEPNGDPVCAPVFYVSELARSRGVVVCQVGEGADELLLGYPSWRRTLRQQPLARRAPRRLLSLLRPLLRRRGPRAEAIVDRAAAGRPLFWSGAEAFGEAEKRLLVAPSVQRRLGGLDTWDDVLAPLHAEFLARAWEPSDLHWMTTADLLVRLPELLLMRVDKMSMGASLEARVPFLDPRFIELSLSIPTDRKVGRGGELKRLLRGAVRGLVPDELLDRPKQGFGVPVTDWLAGDLGRIARRELDRFAADAGLIDRAAPRALVDARDWRAWVLLDLALWWRTFIAREPVGPYA